MSIHKAKIDTADRWFALFIKERDGWECQSCHKQLEHDPGRLHNSHYWGRGRESTRFDPENCDALCFYCHDTWEGEKQGDYKHFKEKQLGQARYTQLMARAYTPGKRDRKAQLIIWRTAYRDLCAEKGITPRKI